MFANNLVEDTCSYQQKKHKYIRSHQLLSRTQSDLLVVRLIGLIGQPKYCSEKCFRELMRQLSVQPTTISEYSVYKQKYHEDCRFAQGINNKSADRFTLQIKRTVVANTAVCMFTTRSARTERRASQVSFCQEALLWHKGRIRRSEGGQL